MDSSIVQEVRSLLLLRDNGTLIDLCEEDRRFWKALRLNLNEGDDVLRHRAIEAVAGLMQR
ncbi:MAG: hypothetical protein JSV02_01585 [Dehalococcoidia bacterium]|nr:MAG: hypothetical protein JSV02_01585 [Dehalococcoidia bacterium]